MRIEVSTPKPTTYYMCEGCNMKYYTPQEAEYCENKHACKHKKVRYSFWEEYTGIEFHKTCDDICYEELEKPIKMDFPQDKLAVLFEFVKKLKASS